MKSQCKMNWSQMTKQVGTPNWMAPEVFTSDSYDQKVDVYSFGVIVHEIVTRDIPFDECAPEKVGLLIVRGVRPDMALITSDCPDTLRALIPNCWAQDPGARPTFKQICAKLDAFRPTELPRASCPYKQELSCDLESLLELQGALNSRGTVSL